MALLVYGVNHHSAPIDIREKLTFDPKRLPEALTELKQQDAVEEAIILSTCNRTEIITHLSSYFSLQQWLQKQKNLAHLELSSYDYAFHDIEAVSHVMRVASGLDSMVLGEPQIFGQIKQAYQIAQSSGSVGQRLTQLFKMVFETGKEVRSSTDICAHPVSLAYVIMQIAKNEFRSFADKRILIIGSGEITDLVTTHFLEQNPLSITIANRTPEKVKHLTTSNVVTIAHIGQLPQLIKNADIIISATRSQLPIIGKGTLETASTVRDQQPQFIFDLAVPRDVEPEAATLPQVYLYNIDDLQKIISNNLQNRQEAALEAEKIIAAKAEKFFQELQVRSARDIIINFRKCLESMRDHELNKALDQLRTGIDPQIVLEQFARSLTNKILHQPTIKLREAASEAQSETLQLAKHLFELG